MQFHKTNIYFQTRTQIDKKTTKQKMNKNLVLFSMNIFKQCLFFLQYKTASSALSVGGLRQQFSFEENIQMSLYGADFFRNAHVFLHIAGEPRVDVGFRPNGYLFMATEKSAHVLESNSKLQNSLGARNVLLTPDKLKTIFPWVNTDGIALACLGIEKEGWFDPWAYLTALRKKCISLGVRYVKGEVKGLTFKDGSDVMDSETGKAVIQLPEKVVVSKKKICIRTFYIKKCEKFQIN